MSKRSVAIATASALALAALLAGCAAPSPTPTADASRSAKPTGSPTSSEVPRAADDQARDTITSIVVRPEMLQLMDKNGAEVETISYDASAEEFVGMFTSLMKAEPAVTENPGGMESSPTTMYTWDGFELADDHERDGGVSDMDVAVTFTKPQLGPRAITVATIQGFKPGDDLRWLAKYMNEPFNEGADFNQIQAEHGAPIGDQLPGSPYSNSNSVTGQNLYQHEGSVVFAPWNFGIGHV